MKVYSVILFALLLSCNQKDKSPVISVDPAKNSPRAEHDETFWSFLEQFSTDSSFQIARTIDSLMRSDSNFSKNQFIYAQLKNKAVGFGPARDTMFIGYSVTVSGDSVREKIFDDGGTSSSERIFKRLRGKWYLVRYEKLDWY